MTDFDQQDEDKICCNCIRESYLSSVVERTGEIHRCSYCGENAETITLEEFCDRIEVAFEQHYQRTPGQPDAFECAMLSDRESDYNWCRDGYDTANAIMNAADISEQAASDAQEILSDRHADIEMHKMHEECEFNSEAHYEEISPSDQAWQHEWFQFEKSLKHETRYFNQLGFQHLKNVFNRIDRLSTQDGSSLVISVGPECNISEIYRARVFQSEEKLCEAMERPDIFMANPPPKLAIAGRMNAHGVSVFYGANNPQTAIAEVRPPVGSQVLVAWFNFLEELRLLDLTALDSVSESGSIFDKEWATRLERSAFLRTLSQRMTRPVMPDDETLEYLPTQAIADFLSSENNPSLDGILFPSVQAESQGLNIVLFQKAARVAELESPKGASITARTGMIGVDGWEIDYRVTEELPSSNELSETIDDGFGTTDLTNFSDSLYADFCQPDTLRTDHESMSIHVVKRIRYECDENSVTWTRFPQLTMNF